MMKSDIDIKDDVYAHIKGSALEKEVPYNPPCSVPPAELFT